MVGPTLKFIVCLIFSKYTIQKTLSYFLDLKQDFENGLGGVLGYIKCFNDIVINKLKTVDSTYLSKCFYLLNLGIYFYHKKNSHTSNLKFIIKTNLQVTFGNFFKISKIEIIS